MALKIGILTLPITENYGGILQSLALYKFLDAQGHDVVLIYKDTYQDFWKKLSKKINRVIVSTDSQEIANIALQFNAEVPFLRPDELASDKSRDIDYILHSLDWLKNNENYTPDLIILLRPTTPLRETKFIDKAIDQMIQQRNATSLRSSHLVPETPFKWFSLKGNFYAPICDNYTLEDTNNPRQSFPEIYVPNGYVDIIKPDVIKKQNSLYGNKIFAFITPLGYEVDTLEDFEYIEYLIFKKI